MMTLRKLFTVALLSACLPASVLAANRTDYRYARNVTQSGSNWATPGLSRYDPLCGGGCSCSSADCAVNSISGNREWLRASNFELVPTDLSDGSRWIRRVVVNIHGKHATGGTSTWDVRVIVRDFVGTIVRDEIRTITFGNTTVCDYRVPEPERDITNMWDWNQEPDVLDNIELWVRRGNNNSAMYVNAFRLRVDSEDLPGCGLSATRIDFGSALPGQSVDRNFNISNVGGGQLRGAVDGSSCAGEPFSIVAGGGVYDLGPGQSRIVTVRYSPIAYTGAPDECLIDPNDENADCGLVDLIGTTQEPCVLSPTALDFGSVPVGGSADRSFTLTNTGFVPLSGAIEPPAQSTFSLVAGGGAYLLAPGASRTVTVRYTPDLPFGDGDFVATGCENDVTLLGMGVTGCALSTTLLDFGDVRVGESAVRTFTVHNVAVLPITGDARLSAGSDSMGFSIIQGGGPYTIAPGQSRDVSVRFAPMGRPGAVASVVDLGTPCPGVVVKFAEALVDAAPSIPLRTEIRSAAPNPARGVTRLEFALSASTNVRLVIYDALGRRVRDILNGAMSAGLHSVAWDVRNNDGVPVHPGVYFAELSGIGTRSKKSILVIR